MHYPSAAPVAAAASAWALQDLSGPASFADFGSGPSAAPAAPAHPSHVAWADVERMVAEAAEAGANAAMTQLEAQAEQIAAQAYAQGVEAGRTEGETGEAARLRHAVGAAEEALDIMRANEAHWNGVIDENVCALATAVARQILGRELSTDGAAVADLVRHALKELPIDQPVAVRVNPQDLQLLTGASAEGALAGRDGRWVADAKVAPGGCMIEGRDRIVDGRVDTALERLYRKLTYNDA